MLCLVFVPDKLPKHVLTIGFPVFSSVPPPCFIKYKYCGEFQVKNPILKNK